MSGQPEGAREIREHIRNVGRDAVTKLLLSNSQLTGAQLETLLAYSLTMERHVAKAGRRLYRPGKGLISRGSFNRTLIQAQNNVIRSIYTILLLGYLGLFDSPSLQPFLELADTIQGYVREVREAGEGDRRLLDQLSTKLAEGVTALATRRSFKDTL